MTLSTAVLSRKRRRGSLALRLARLKDLVDLREELLQSLVVELLDLEGPVTLRAAVVGEKHRDVVLLRHAELAHARRWLDGQGCVLELLLLAQLAHLRFKGAVLADEDEETVELAARRGGYLLQFASDGRQRGAGFARE